MYVAWGCKRQKCVMEFISFFQKLFILEVIRGLRIFPHVGFTVLYVLNDTWIPSNKAGQKISFRYQKIKGD